MFFLFQLCFQAVKDLERQFSFIVLNNFKYSLIVKAAVTNLQIGAVVKFYFLKPVNYR